MYYDSLQLECSSSLQKACDVIQIMTRSLCIMTRFSLNVVHPFRRRVALVQIMTRRVCIMTRFSLNVVHPFRRRVMSYKLWLVYYIMTRFSLNVVHPFRRRVALVHIMTRRLSIMTRFSLNVVHPFRRRVALVQIMTRRLYYDSLQLECSWSLQKTCGWRTYLWLLCIMTLFSVNVVHPFRHILLLVCYVLWLASAWM